MFANINSYSERMLLYSLLLLAVFIIRIVIINLYKRRKKISGIDNFIVGINTISLIAFVIIIFFAFLQLINIDVKHFFTSISIIAAAIAILSKDYISNAINGMMLMFNSNIEIGDYVKIDEQKGVIKNLSLLNVQLESEEGDLVLIPNNIVLNNQIINYTKGDTRKAQIELPIPISMLEDIEKTEDFFKEPIKGYIHRANINSFKLRIIDIKKDVVMIRLSLLLHEADVGIDKEIRKKWISKWATIKQKLDN